MIIWCNGNIMTSQNEFSNDMLTSQNYLSYLVIVTYNGFVEFTDVTAKNIFMLLKLG